MNRFVYDIPTKLFFGEGQIKHLNNLAKSFGKNILFLYGGGSIKRNGLYDLIYSHLAEFNLIELNGIEANPKIELVEKGINLCHEHHIDLILAVGGGSVIDSGKLISAGAMSKTPPWTLVKNPKLILDSLPLMAITTISGTGSEMNGNAVISSSDTNEKINFYSYHFFPDFAICDPTYTYEVPPALTAGGAIDTISHAIEMYFQEEQGTFIQDGISESVMKACLHYLPTVLKSPRDYESKANLMWASTTALNRLTSFGKRGDYSLHHIEHILSAYYDIPHALGIAILMPRWLAYTLNANTVSVFNKFAKNVLGLEVSSTPYKTAKEAILMLYDFIESSELPLTLPEVGITDQQLFAKMAEEAEKMLNNSFVTLNDYDVTQIFEDSMTPGVTFRL